MFKRHILRWHVGVPGKVFSHWPPGISELKLLVMAVFKSFWMSFPPSFLWKTSMGYMVHILGNLRKKTMMTVGSHVAS